MNPPDGPADHAAALAALQRRLDQVRGRIVAAGGDLDVVRILAVSKGVEAPRLEVARAAGLHDLGESYAQELVAKAEGPLSAHPDLRWHFVGRLQRNKVRLVAPFVHLWQSVDRLSLAAEVARRAPGARVLVQVDVAGADARDRLHDLDGLEALQRVADADQRAVLGLRFITFGDKSGGSARRERLGDERMPVALVLQRDEEITGLKRARVDREPRHGRAARALGTANCGTNQFVKSPQGGVRHQWCPIASSGTLFCCLCSGS